MSKVAPRVVVLSRDGAAGAKLQAAFVEAGAEVVLVADPSDVDVQHVLSLAPYAVLVALDPVVEDALERLGPLLADPDMIVLFEEADVVVQREGWDQARWSRHLAAKLHRHDDVLPPGGAEDDFDWQPSPGALPQVTQAVDLDAAIAAFEHEALTLADDVPREGGLPVSDAGAPSPFDPVAAETVGADDVPTAYDTIDFDGTALSNLEDDEEERVDVSVSMGDDDFSGITLDLDDDDGELAASLADVADHTSARGLPLDDGFDHAAAAAALEGRAPSEDVLAFDGLDDDDAEIEATEVAGTADIAKREFAFGLADADTAIAAVEKPVFDANLGSGLSLADPDDVPLAAPAARRDHTDLEALSARASSLSLADEDSYGHGPLRGAILVEAGLGGPDAVRQLLAALPEGFPRPVLVRMQLDGGRYDRLVQQMGRAASLPVALAEPAHVAEPGTVYFLPPALGVTRKGAQLQFVDGTSDDDVLSHLPANDSAVLFLSGAEPARVPLAIERRAEGLLLASQSSDGCYDARAADAAAAGGAVVAAPADLADQLRARWPA